jgi:hypothetical protein
VDLRKGVRINGDHNGDRDGSVMEEAPLDIILSTVCHENKDSAEKSSNLDLCETKVYK